MASISAETFEFVRQSSTYVSVFRYRNHGRMNHEIRLDTYKMVAWRYGDFETIILPRKMAGALMRAALLYNEANPGIREKWKPRWPA